jgi:glycosyl transferase family 25
MMRGRELPPVYVINLDRSAARMRQTRDHLEDLGVPFERVAAVDGAAMTREEVKRDATPFCRAMCTPSMMGCALSHIRTWKTVVRRGQECAVVMEDDAVLVPDFRARLRRAMAEVPADYDVLVLGCFFMCDREREYGPGPAQARPFLRTRDDRRTWGSVYVPERFAGTHCYLVSRKGCEKLLRLIPRADYHIDVQMNHPDLDLYAVGPDLAHQRDMGQSVIASYDFPKTLVPGLSAVKDRKNVTLAYYLDVPFAQVAGQPVNAWMTLFLAAGLAFPAAAAPFVAGLALAELAVGGRPLAPLLAFLAGWGVRSVVTRACNGRA